MLTFVKYNVISAVLAACSGVLFALVLRELPHNDGVHGDYITVLMALVREAPGTGPELRPLSPFAITEERIVSVLFAGVFVCAFFAIIAGLLARKRGENAGAHAASVAVSVVLLIVAFRYKWIFGW